MNYQEISSKDLIYKILKNHQDINTSNYCMDVVESAKDTEMSEKISLMQKIIGSNKFAIDSQKEMTSEVLKRIDFILESRKTKKAVNPSKKKMKQLISSFFSDSLPFSSFPYPPLCGALSADNDKLIEPDSFVCVKNSDGDYILGIILDFDPETSSYLVCDADPEMTNVVTFSVYYKDVIPLPTSSPTRRNKQTTYGVKSRVLALWYDDVGGWTSVFYKATVMKTPQTQECYYYLKYDGTPPMNAYVQEKFIVYSPED